MTTLIIGGGMAGMAAAIAARASGQRVIVLERNRKPLKKLGVSGNGRGNLLNSGEPRYFGDSAFARAVLAQHPYSALRAFWEALGVPLREEEEGRVYPASLTAASAVDALRLRADQLGVEVQPLTRVTALRQEGGGFRAEVLRAQYDETGRKPRLLGEAPDALCADRVIVAAGGAAAPAHGTDGSGYALLTAFGHRLITPRPALSALLTDKKRLEGLSGQRVRAALTLCDRGGQPLHAASGELLFGDDALSGIAAMQLARFAEDGAAVTLDLRPALAMEDVSPTRLAELLLRWADARRERPLGDWLTGAFAPPVARFLLREAGLPDLRAPMARRPEAQRLADTLAALRLPLRGVRGFEQAQVTAGGIDPADFDPATLESRLCPGLFAVGEVLNVDGDCGGFNLMFALASGMGAGERGARR